VRELRNLLEYAAIVTNGELIQPEHLRLQSVPLGQEGGDADRITLNFNFTAEEFSLDAVAKQVTNWAMGKCNNNKSAAARLLKASRKIFY
jgi:DNA-binding NtrC family response regulator